MPRRKWFQFESRDRFKEDEGGINAAWWVTHISVGREVSEDSPYLIPNEWIAGNIAQLLRLPIPPFALMRSDPNHRGMFTSFRFGGRVLSPRDMEPGPCVVNDPDLCTGILLFDIFVANGDRHTGNLKVDSRLNPKELSIFDHDRALFGFEEKEGAARLGEIRDRLGVSNGSEPGDSPHCLLEVLNTATYFDKWLDRIYSIPEYFIDGICHEVNDWLSTEEIETAAFFLKYRAKRLHEIIYKPHNKQQFTSIKDWGLHQCHKIAAT